ncbi:MAG: hypothetical protein AB1921_13695 [Thermodesulfobacteriota bacterium]
MGHHLLELLFRANTRAPRRDPVLMVVAVAVRVGMTFIAVVVPGTLSVLMGMAVLVLVGMAVAPLLPVPVLVLVGVDMGMTVAAVVRMLVNVLAARLMLVGVAVAGSVCVNVLVLVRGVPVAVGRASAVGMMVVMRALALGMMMKNGSDIHFSAPCC